MASEPIDPTAREKCAGADWQRGVRRLAAELRAFRTLPELHASRLWLAESRALETLLETIHVGVPAHERPPGDGLRIVQWNILKGISFEGLRRALTEHVGLRDPDFLLLNEVDVGMARSGNRHVASELADALGMHWAFIPSYLELTKGPGEDAAAPGENASGLHGVAILSHREPLRLAAAELPETFDYFSFSEKRYGRRRALLAGFAGGLVVAAVHLEVRGVPRDRARQIRALLDHIERFCAAEESLGRPVKLVLLAGDLNTHTFPRGTFLRSVRGFLRLLLTPQMRLRAQLDEPWHGGREMLFEELRRAGFVWEMLNDRRPTAFSAITSIEESASFPKPMRDRIARVFGDDPRGLPLRLDWIAARGKLPPITRAESIEELLAPGGPSDHAPLVVDLRRAL